MDGPDPMASPVVTRVSLPGVTTTPSGSPPNVTVATTVLVARGYGTKLADPGCPLNCRYRG